MIFEKEESWDKMAILYANVEIIIRCAGKKKMIFNNLICFRNIEICNRRLNNFTISSVWNKKVTLWINHLSYE